jgi:hypothetical protein
MTIDHTRPVCSCIVEVFLRAKRMLAVAAAVAAAGCATAFALGSASAGAATTTTTSTTATTPTATQIKKAIATATKSSSLWVTINACRQQGSDRGTIGVRGQMPGLGFPAQLKLTLTVSYFSSSDNRYEVVRGSSRTLALGSLTKGTVQDGIQYTLTAPVNVVADATFDWYYAGKLIGSTTKATTGGHSKQVKHSVPAGYSVAACSLS